MEPTYPFAPKSTRWLLRGQFWALHLANGKFGAACVVGSHLSSGKASSRAFIAGVIDWVGTSPPTPTDLESRPIIRHAFAHIKAIADSGSEILGLANIDLIGAPESAESLSLPTWGLHFPTLLAQKLAEQSIHG
jgi:hypothetical protein